MKLSVFIYKACVSSDFIAKKKKRTNHCNLHRKYLLCLVSILGHARLTEPPGRSTAWRFGFHTPRNDNDNELNCGGFNVSTTALHY